MKLYEICFSPTGGTKKVADMIAKELSEDFQFIDLTDPSADFSDSVISGDDVAVAVIAVPSYGGRVPAVAAARLAHIKGSGARAVLVCVYGNRAYEDTLTELEDIATASDFKVICAAAALPSIPSPASLPKAVLTQKIPRSCPCSAKKFLKKSGLAQQIHR